MEIKNNLIASLTEVQSFELCVFAEYDKEDNYIWVHMVNYSNENCLIIGGRVVGDSLELWDYSRGANYEPTRMSIASTKELFQLLDNWNNEQVFENLGI